MEVRSQTPSQILKREMCMHTLTRTLTLTTGMFVSLSLPLPAQWRDVVTKSVPLTSAGTLNFEAPAPKLADGTPDLSGLWDAEKQPCNEASVRGCLDSLGAPIALAISPPPPPTPALPARTSYQSNRGWGLWSSNAGTTHPGTR